LALDGGNAVECHRALTFLAHTSNEWKKVSTAEAIAKDSPTPTFGISNRRYIGGKSLLIPAIHRAIPDRVKRGTFCDIFAGTGVVGASALGTFKNVILNDFLYSNEIVYKGFYGKGSFSLSKLESFRNEMAIRIQKSKKENYFSRNFSGKYFSPSAARAIGLIRDAIEENSYQFNSRERAIAIASLIYSADRIANTVGHYEAYRKGVLDFKDLEYRLIEASRDLKAEIYRSDSNALARKIKSDVVYIDPPYNSRQYSRFYHVLETLTKWDQPLLQGVALKPPIENISEYCKVGAANAFEDLISNLDTRIIVVSYNNTYESKSTSSRNKISLKEITSILKLTGSTQIKKIPYKHFSAGNTNFDNHLEYLFVTEVN
jgi:adenine-specific DNA-methyltransferase